MSDEDKKFYLSIVADKKSYFQQYIYSSLRKDYMSYVANTKRKALRLFRKDVDELMATPEEERTPEEREFLFNYELYNPVVDGTDTINRICHRIEKEFAGYITRQKEELEFDHNILKSGTPYSDRQYKAIRKLYMEYRGRVEEYSKAARKKRVDSYDMNERTALMKEDFKRRCEEQCPGAEMLCDIIVDIAYEREGTRQFAWDIVGDQIIKNLLAHNDGKINIPVLDDENGDVEFRGHKYRMETVDYPSGQEEEEEYVYL